MAPSLTGKPLQLIMSTPTCKRHYNNGVSFFRDSTFASKALLRRPYVFQKG